MALALSRSDIAFNRIREFLTNNNNQALEDARAESIGGVRFHRTWSKLVRSTVLSSWFSQGGYNSDFRDCFGTRGLREPRAVVVDDVNLMINFLASMIGSIKRKVDAAHIITTKSHYANCPLIQPIVLGDRTEFGGRKVFVIDGYSHEENDVRLEFFDAQRDNLPCEQPSPWQEQAWLDAIQARRKGVTDELAFLGVPGFQQILQSWRNLLCPEFLAPGCGGTNL